MVLPAAVTGTTGEDDPSWLVEAGAIEVCMMPLGWDDTIVRCAAVQDAVGATGDLVTTSGVDETGGHPPLQTMVLLAWTLPRKAKWVLGVVPQVQTVV